MHMTKLMPFALLLSLLILVAAALPAAMAAGPRISFNQETWDLGTHPQETQVYHDLVISNTGTADLNLTDVNPPCGCTIVDRAQYPLVLKPGQSHTVNVSFNTNNYDGNVTKVIYITSNDTSRPEVMLSFYTNVAPSTGSTTFTIPATDTTTSFKTPTGSPTPTQSPVSWAGVVVALAASALLLASRRR